MKKILLRLLNSVGLYTKSQLQPPVPLIVEKTRNVIKIQDNVQLPKTKFYIDICSDEDRLKTFHYSRLKHEILPHLKVMGGYTEKGEFIHCRCELLIVENTGD